VRDEALQKLSRLIGQQLHVPPADKEVRHEQD
jgi:hypothetical protein